MSLSNNQPGLPPTTSPPSRLMNIRPARFREIPLMARVSSLAFWDDVLFGRMIHPHRNQYPGDFDKYWLQRFYADWFQWDHVLLVSVEEVEDDYVKGQTKQIITGQAVWGRIDSRKENWNAGWGLAWWDPRRLLKLILTPIINVYYKYISKNKAINPEHSDIIERSYPFLDHIWQGPKRSKSWLLEYTAVHPDYQNRGIGRKLVQWGLNQAEAEKITASVIAAEGKENFYKNCGFIIGPVGYSGEGGDENPLKNVPGGKIFFTE